MKAFYSPDEHPYLWPLMQQLTELRNLVAHGLVDDITDQRIKIIDKLREEVGNPPEELNPLQAELDDEEIIQMMFGYTTGALQGMVEEISVTSS